MKSPTDYARMSIISHDPDRTLWNDLIFGHAIWNSANSQDRAILVYTETTLVFPKAEKMPGPKYPEPGKTKVVSVYFERPQASIR